MVNKQNIRTVTVVAGRTLPKNWTLARVDHRQVSEDRYEVQVAVITRSGEVESYTWLPYREGAFLPDFVSGSFYDPIRPWF